MVDTRISTEANAHRCDIYHFSCKFNIHVATFVTAPDKSWFISSYQEFNFEAKIIIKKWYKKRAGADWRNGIEGIRIIGRDN